MSQININLPSVQNRIENLTKEVQNLRSFVIGLIGKDREGKYRPAFVKKIMNMAKEPSDFVFKDKTSFLSQLQK